MTTTAPSRLQALARIFRLEYLAASLPGMSITFFLCATAPTDLLRRGPVEGLLVIALVIFSCLGMNAIVDREIDGQYATGTSGISSSRAKRGFRVRAVPVAQGTCRLSGT